MAYFEGNEMTGGYGNGPDIINSCTVNVNKGEIVSILGPNGAGKSTAMKAMLGLLNLKSGTVVIDGKDISKLSPQDRVKEGISFDLLINFQQVHLLNDLNLENQQPLWLFL